MKTSVIAASAIVALLIAGVATVAFAHSGNALAGITNSSQGHANGQDERWHQCGNATATHNDNESEVGSEHEGVGGRVNLTLGATFSISNLTGQFRSASNESVIGNASGTFTFDVTGVFAKGVTLSIASGNFTLGNSTLVVSGGTLVLNAGGEHGVGSGTAGNASFLIRLDGLHGGCGSASAGSLKLDVLNGSTEYLVVLGAHESQD